MAKQFKKLRFDLNKFKKFKDKIIYVPVEDMPSGDNPYERENSETVFLEELKMLKILI